jgi:hypothetical protein
MPVSAEYKPTECGLFFALLYREDKDLYQKTKEKIEADWGKITTELKPQHFPMKEYYAKEMGTPLGRVYLVLEGKRHRNSLIEAKQWAMKLEREFSEGENRMVNIDPGSICLEQLLLISTKPYSHRIFVGDNLYTELTYQFQQGEYRPRAWTYPDYTEAQVLNFFTKSRNLLK